MCKFEETRCCQMIQGTEGSTFFLICNYHTLLRQQRGRGCMQGFEHVHGEIMEMAAVRLRLTSVSVHALESSESS